MREALTGQNKVWGKVVDVLTGEGLSFVRVEVFQNQNLVFAGITDENGHFSIPVPENGDLVLYFRKPNWEARVVPFQAEAYQGEFISLEMSKLQMQRRIEIHMKPMVMEGNKKVEVKPAKNLPAMDYSGLLEHQWNKEKDFREVEENKKTVQD